MPAPEDLPPQENDPPAVQELPSPDKQAQLVEENATLKARLEEYKKLDEDLAAKRVFEKARGYLTTWITLGGIILTIAGFIGYKTVVDYFKEVAKKKADAVTEEQIQKSLEASINIRVDAGVTRALPQISEQIRKQITQSTQPLTGSTPATLSPSPTPSPAPAGLVDWSTDMQPPRDIGDEGAVVGFALAGALEFYVSKATGTRVMISPRDIYNEVRIKENTLSTDAGALISDGIEFLTRTGAVDEKAWPYRPGEYAQPVPASLAHEKRYKIRDAKQIVTLDDLKAALASGPAVVGVTIYSSWYSDDATKTGRIPMRKPKEPATGGVSLCIVGYDDSKKLLKFWHMWGPKWGDHGYGYLHYDYFRQESGDCWTFRYAGD